MDRLTNRLGRLPLTWMAAVATGAILVTAFLQFRGSEQVSRALQQRLGASLQSAAGRFAKGLDRELTRVVLFFDPPPPFEGGDLEETYIERFRRWSETAPFPGLVQRVYLIRRVDEAGVDARVLDRDSQVFGPAACPDAYENLCQRLSTPDEWRPGPPGMPPTFERGKGPLDADNEAVVLRIVSFRRHERRAGPPEGPPPLSGAVIVILDPKVIREEILPELASHTFAGNELSGYRLTVFPADEPGKTVYDSRPDVQGPVPSSGDAEADLFRGLPPPEVRSLEQELGLHFWKTREHPEPEPPPPFPGREARDHSPDFGMRFSADDGPGPWRVVVTHPEGSLQTIAGRVRLQSLFVSLGTLALLGLSLAAILVSARRTQALATQQLEFIAGVTHELMTPLAAMRSAGQNLADGIVRDEERVRRYGSMIDAEGRRLAEMVGKVLDFAGMRQQTKRPLERVSVRDWIERVVADNEHLRAEGDFELEVEIAEDAEILGDPDALHTALGNLLTNAFKYAQQGHWASIRTSTETGRHGAQVQIRVADRGPGIRAEDVPHVFEPFYRGRRLAASNVPGSGLGLALVRNIIEAHGGKVRLETVEGGGSTFILTLPAAAEEPT